LPIEVAIHHETRYAYDRLVRLEPQTIRLRPAPHGRTPIRSYSLRVEPAEHFLNWLQDPSGNYLARVVIPDPVHALHVTVDLVAEIGELDPFAFFVAEEAADWPFVYESEMAEELFPLRVIHPPEARLAEWIASVPRTPVATVDLLVELNQRIHRTLEYQVRLEPGVQTPEETLSLGRGSCRDSAWLLVVLLRHLGIAARFTSGYLIQLSPDDPAADRGDLHAWAEAYIPGAGWIGLDTTSGLLAGAGHLPLASSPRPQSAAPISGRLGPCVVSFEHQIRVERLAAAGVAPSGPPPAP